MFKAKLGAVAIACMIGSVYINPVNALAAEVNTESVTLSDKNDNQDNNRSAFRERMKKASENWNSLSSKQKKEIYTLLQKEVKANMKLMDKLAEYGVFEEEDVNTYKTRLLEKFNNVIQNGEFPLLMQKKSSK